MKTTPLSKQTITKVSYLIVSTHGTSTTMD